MTSSSRHRQRGSAIVEFAFIMPVLMLLALGVVDFALVIQAGIAVNAAANAGSDFGAVEGNENNISGMQSAALAAAPYVTMTATASTWCVCSVNSSTTVSCTTTTCNTYDLPVQYVQVTTQASVPMLFHFPGLPLSIGLSGFSILRAR